MKEAPSSSEMSVLTRATRRNIPEDTILIVTAAKTSNVTWFYDVNETKARNVRA
jgi:hypothetical protein